MYIVELNEDNRADYSEYISEDISENIGRTFYHGLIAEEEDKPIAGIIWEIRNALSDKDNISNIVWLRIDDENVAVELFDKYRECVAEEDVVTSSYCLPAISMDKEKKALEDAGFSMAFTEGDLIKARLSEIDEIAYIKKAKTKEYIKPLKNLTQREFVSSVRRFTTKGLFGLCEDLPYLSKAYFENDVSCYLEEDGDIIGLLLFHKKPSGTLEVVIMQVLGNEHVKDLLSMMCQALSAAKEIYDQQTEICIDRHNYSTLALSEKLFPRGFGIPVYTGSRNER
ncbi:MAG: hypothetical protein II842_01980 [Butyrivibrio sp.]|nr:hypothetical protein [Butyrivibrio sp.]